MPKDTDGLDSEDDGRNDSSKKKNGDTTRKSNTTTVASVIDVMKLLQNHHAAKSVLAKESGTAASTATTPETKKASSPFQLAPFNPSSDQIQKIALTMLSLSESDVLFDLGCGDGRFLCHAASQIPGLRCVGIEVEKEYVDRAREMVAACGLESSIDIRLEDATQAPRASAGDDNDDDGNNNSSTGRGSPPKVTDLTLQDDSTALYLFILPRGIQKMMPILESLKQKRQKSGKRFRVLSYMFQIHDWVPTVTMETPKGSCPVYYYDFGGR